jgi:hypothetical protein
LRRTTAASADFRGADDNIPPEAIEGSGGRSTCRRPGQMVVYDGAQLFFDRKFEEPGGL